MSSEHHEHSHHEDGHHSHSILPKHVLSTREQLDDMHIGMKYRDQCVDFLVVLQRCRADYGTNPFTCKHERHQYEQCTYELLKQNQQ